MNIHTVKITRVSMKDTKKDGSKMVSKNGKPYWNVGIQTDKFGDSWFSALAFAPDDAVYKLKEGDTVEIVIEGDGQYKNFRIPSKADKLELRVANLEERIKALEGGKKSEKASPDEAPDYGGL